jgi:putative membrane protein insertion efficiency factor
MLPSQISSGTFELPGAADTRACNPASGSGLSSMIATLPQRLALTLIRGYQLLISPMFAGSCRYVPSCSNYAIEAVSRFGVLRGSWLALRRLSRCHPLGGQGLDPVPAFASSDGQSPRERSARKTNP